MTETAPATTTGARTIVVTLTGEEYGGVSDAFGRVESADEHLTAAAAAADRKIAGAWEAAGRTAEAAAGAGVYQDLAYRVVFRRPDGADWPDLVRGKARYHVTEVSVTVRVHRGVFGTGWPEASQGQRIRADHSLGNRIGPGQGYCGGAAEAKGDEFRRLALAAAKAAYGALITGRPAAGEDRLDDDFARLARRITLLRPPPGDAGATLAELTAAAGELIRTGVLPRRDATRTALSRYALSPGTAGWIARRYGSSAAEPREVTPYEASGVIGEAISQGMITGGPAEPAVSCIATEEGEPDGWKMLIGPRHLDYWLASAMLRASDRPATYLALVQDAVGVLNRIVADCENRGLAALFDAS
jgi:hypothetical protein